jgi:hypothetical protein
MPNQIDALPPSPDWGEVRHWRKLVRDYLLQRRTALSADARRALGERACTRAVQAIDLKAYNVCALLQGLALPSDQTKGKRVLHEGRGSPQR